MVHGLPEVGSNNVEVRCNVGACIAAVDLHLDNDDSLVLDGWQVASGAAYRGSVASVSILWPQDAVPWAFPRNFRAPPLQTSRRQRLLSFLRGASPQRNGPAVAAGSSSCAGAGSRGQQGPPSTHTAEPPHGTAIAGSAAVDGTNGVVSSQLSAAVEAAPAAQVLASPTQQLLLPPHKSSSAPQPDLPAQRHPAMQYGAASGEGSSWINSKPAPRHLDSMAAQHRFEHLQQKQQPPPFQGASLGPPAADGGTVSAPLLSNGLHASSQGGRSGQSGIVDTTAVSSGSAALGAQAAYGVSPGSLRASFGGGNLQPPTSSLMPAESSGLLDGASGGF